MGKMYIMMVLHLYKSKTQELWNMKCALFINDMKIEVKVTTIHGKLCNLPLFTTCARLFFTGICIQFVTWIPSEVRKNQIGIITLIIMCIIWTKRA